MATKRSSSISARTNSTQRVPTQSVSEPKPFVVATPDDFQPVEVIGPASGKGYYVIANFDITTAYAEGRISNPLSEAIGTLAEEGTVKADDDGNITVDTEVSSRNNAKLYDMMVCMAVVEPVIEYDRKTWLANRNSCIWVGAIPREDKEAIVAAINGEVEKYASFRDE